MSGCLFCDEPTLAHPFENESAFVRWDNFPSSEGHMQVVPKRHVVSFFELSSMEVQNIYDLACLAQDGQNADGWTIGINEGRAAGRTVDHLHVHLIPRRHGDVVDPSGGVRQVLPGTAAYWGGTRPLWRGTRVSSMERRARHRGAMEYAGILNWAVVKLAADASVTMADKENAALSVEINRLRAELVATKRLCRRVGEFAEQRHLLDPLDHTFETLPVHHCKEDGS